MVDDLLILIAHQYEGARVPRFNVMSTLVYAWDMSGTIDTHFTECI